ncbi:MAG: hypothetical protein ACYC61_03395, partial [Isosphaeraceae bacterium]
MNRLLATLLLLALLGPSAAGFAADEDGPPLPGTKPLTMKGDIASELVAGVDRFLLRQIDESTAKRAGFWKRDTSSARAYAASVEPNRKRLAHILGVRDPRTDAPRIIRLDDPTDPTRSVAGKVLKGVKEVHSICWPAFDDVTGEGLELGSGDTCVIVIP